MKSELRSNDELGRLAGRRLNRPAATGEVCLDAEQLAAYVDGGLSAPEVDRVDAHLATCAECRATLSRLSPMEEEAEAPALGWLHAVPRVDAKWLSLAAMLIVGVSVWMAWPGAVRREGSPPSLASANEESRAPRAAPVATPASRPPEGKVAAAPAEALARAQAVPPPALAERALQAPERAQQSSAGRASGALGPRVLAAAKRRAEPSSPPVAGTDEGSPAVSDRNSDRRDVAAKFTSPVAPALAEARREAAAADALRERQAAVAAAPPPRPVPAEAEALSDALKPQTAASQDTASVAAGGATPTAAPSAAGATLASSSAVKATGGVIIFMEPERRLWWRIVGGSSVESSSDGGLAWNSSLRDRSVRLLAGSAPEIGVVWVAGAGGVVMRRATPLGWTRLAPPTSEDLVAITASSGEAARVTARSGQVYETSDGGATWAAR